MRIPALATAIVALGLGACAAVPSETLLAGETMGSAWTAKVVGPLPMPEAQLREGMQARFEAVNQALSTYRRDSALSRFNADTTGEWVALDPELAEVMSFALRLSERSGGAYDVTVGPLVDLWGFGPAPSQRKVPDDADIARAREHVGWRKIEIDGARRARKPPGVRVDLSSLGKGRGVDRVAEYLDSIGVSNYLIDLSGKLRARGRNSRGEPWRVAVEAPGADAPSGRPAVMPATVALRDESIATAGDYRRFFEADGRHYSHIIDPRSGFPVSHATVSATAIAADCMAADAWATVFMAMSPDDALRLADAASMPALLIRRHGTELTLSPGAHWR